MDVVLGMCTNFDLGSRSTSSRDVNVFADVDVDTGKFVYVTVTVSTKQACHALWLAALGSF